MLKVESEHDFIEITVICGFLGAGKTTLLNRILEQAGDRKLAVLVNDLGKINIDAAEVDNVVRSIDGAISGIVELSSGCICCGVRDELLDALHELIVDHQPEQIVIEATGAAEPRQLLENIYGYNFFRADFGRYVEVKNAVTVVSAHTFLETLRQAKDQSRKSKQLLSVDPRRPLSELQFAQIECSDYILLNKTDTVAEEALGQLVETVKGLNSKAEIACADFARIDVEDLLSRKRFDRKQTLEAAKWNLDLNANRELTLLASEEKQSSVFLPKTKHSDYGIASFVYNARRPFDESRFLGFLRSDIRGLLRAKGYFWTDAKPEQVGFISICGEIQRVDYGLSWWKTRVERGEILVDNLPADVQKVWSSETGDCRQEIVFIGIDLDKQQIKNGLDDCLAY